MITVERYHDISCGHRVYGHEGACAGLHGHNYRVHFTCEVRIEGRPELTNALDDLGRVVDFSVIKAKLCMWLEDNWDHKFLLWEQDPFAHWLEHASGNGSALDDEEASAILLSVITVPVNPTAENMADYLLHVIGPQQLAGTGVTLIKVRVDETRKCSAVAAL